MSQSLPEMLDEFCAVFTPPDDPELWANLIDEETKEVKEACAHLMKELADLAYVTTGYDRAFRLNPIEQEDIPQAHLDVLREAAATAIKTASALEEAELGEQVIQAVHQSNMSKLGFDGQPIRDRETGKVMKGPNYQEPDIESLIFPTATD
jgi:predicted HAD superfamily Cof-like phosphohydrolase